MDRRQHILLLCNIRKDLGTPLLLDRKDIHLIQPCRSHLPT
jgi:hypothetical protein